jgi:plastocyanin
MKRSNVYLRAGALLMALMLALLLAACGSDDNGDDSGAQPEETTVETGGGESSAAAPPGGAQIAVTAQEFEFTGIPESVPAGETTINFTNAGEQPHEFILVSLKDNAPSLDELLKMSEKESEKFFASPPETTFAKPGQTEEGAITTELTSGGRYAYVCFVQDPKTKKPHAFLGMNGEFTVE